MFKACCCRGLQTRPPIRQINCQTVMRHERKLIWGRRVPPIRQINWSLSHIFPYVFRTFDLSFMFHFLVSTYWISIISENETYDFNVSFLVSCFILQNTEGALSRSLSVFELLPQCFCFSPSVFFKWNIETKNET